MKLNQIALALVATLGVAGATHAAVGNGQSYGGTSGDGLLTLSDTVVEVGVDGQLSNATTDFDHFNFYIDLGLAGGHNATTDVYHFSGSDLSWIPSFAPDHTGLGVWSFKEVGSQDVWFGNWAKEIGTTETPDNTTYTTFYIGEKGDVATTVAIDASATYSVETLENFNNTSALPTSTFNVVFGTGAEITSATGDIAFTNAAIAADGSFVKSGGVSVTSTSLTNGNLEGQFYGDTAQAVAGIVTAGTNTADTSNVAFGGTQTSYTLIP